MKQLPKALFNELVNGLQMLLALRLNGSPAADTISATALAWEQALCYGKKWNEQQDQKRFQTAFYALAAECECWPSPSMFLKKLPPPPPVPLLEQHYLLSDADKAKGQEHLKRIKQMLKQCVKPMP